MEVVNEYPPNWDLIKVALPKATGNALFCYGDTVYNPSKQEIQPDRMFHESVHKDQQGDDVDGWYKRYLTDREFRFQQELEAYGKQFMVLKDGVERMADEFRAEGKRLGIGKNNVLEAALDSMASALSGDAYGNLVDFGQARSKIRNYARSLIS